MSKKSLWTFLFGETENKGNRIFEIGGETKNGKPWWIRIGESTNNAVKKLKK